MTAKLCIWKETASIIGVQGARRESLAFSGKAGKHRLTGREGARRYFGGGERGTRHHFSAIATPSRFIVGARRRCRLE